MAKIRFKGALQSAFMPFVSTFQLRTVINPGQDINVRTPRNQNNPQNYTDYSIPQVMYAENVVPTGEGFQSISYQRMVPPVQDGYYWQDGFDQVIPLRDSSENVVLLSPGGGDNWIYNPNVGTWEYNTPILLTPNRLITRAYVNGRTFVCYESQGVWEYVGGTLTKQTLVGLDDADVRGIGSSSNYLLAFGSLDVHWSSLIDPLDFEPSLSSGAGFATPQDVKARITSILGVAGGFIVYTGQNAVAGVYTNNPRAPFSFKEVNGAGGVKTYEQVTADQNSGTHYAWTTSGLQKISIQGAEPVSGEINDFLAGRTWEHYDWATHRLVQHYSGSPEFRTKLTVISNRWLVISYNTVEAMDGFNYALVLDLILNRFGKVKINHRDVFTWPYAVAPSELTYDELMPNEYDDLQNIPYDELVEWIGQDPLSKMSMAFLQSNGAVRLMHMSYNLMRGDEQPDDFQEWWAPKSVVVFGKFQTVRAAMMQMQQLDVEGVRLESRVPDPSGEIPPYPPDLRIWVGTSTDGYTLRTVEEMRLIKKAVGMLRFAKRTTGINLQLMCEGWYSLTSYLLECTDNGDR